MCVWVTVDKFLQNLFVNINSWFMIEPKFNANDPIWKQDSGDGVVRISKIPISLHFRSFYVFVPLCWQRNTFTTNKQTNKNDDWRARACWNLHWHFFCTFTKETWVETMHTLLSRTPTTVNRTHFNCMLLLDSMSVLMIIIPMLLSFRL